MLIAFVTLGWSALFFIGNHALYRIGIGEVDYTFAETIAFINLWVLLQVAVSALLTLVISEGKR